MKKATLAKYLSPAGAPTLTLRSAAPESALAAATSTSVVGGKGQAGVYHRIIGQMPPHSVYVEPFFGNGRVYFSKRPAERNILIDRDPAVIARLGAAGLVHAIRGDALVILPTLALPADAVVYCDPPYLLSTRQGRLYYDFEMSDEQHWKLLKLVLGLPCRVLVSGYPSDLYAEYLKDWRLLRYRVRTRVKTVTECLWCNFPEPDALHDWRFAGKSYRERLYLRRLAKRWLAKLEAMSERKRGYVLNAIAQRQDRRGHLVGDPPAPIPARGSGSPAVAPGPALRL